MSKEYRFQFPLTEEQVRELQMGDIVYLTGLIHTMRDMGHGRAVEMVNRGETLPFDLSTSAIWHCAPIVKQDESGGWHVMAAGSTTSSRFTPLGSDLLEAFHMRCTIGKGTMGPRAVETMQKNGSVFLNTTGGTAALYAQQIEEVAGVHWLDLGLPEAVWMLRVKDFGPLIVGIDSRGGSLYQSMRQDMNLRLKEECEKAGVSLSRNYTYLPVNLLGKPRKQPNTTGSAEK